MKAICLAILLFRRRSHKIKSPIASCVMKAMPPETATTAMRDESAVSGGNAVEGDYHDDGGAKADDATSTSSQSAPSGRQIAETYLKATCIKAGSAWGRGGVG